MFPIRTVYTSNGCTLSMCYSSNFIFRLQDKSYSLGNLLASRLEGFKEEKYFFYNNVLLFKLYLITT